MKKILNNKLSNLIDAIKQAILSSLQEDMEKAEAIGIFGSLANGKFHDRSDIDIFVVVKKRDKDFLKEDDFWYHKIKQALKDFKRDITLLIYSIKGLKEISNWYVFRLAKEGILLYDKSNIKGLFELMLEAGRKAGIEEIQRGDEYVFGFKDLKIDEIRKVKVIDGKK